MKFLSSCGRNHCLQVFDRAYGFLEGNAFAPVAIRFKVSFLGELETSVSLGRVGRKYNSEYLDHQFTWCCSNFADNFSS
jgi:hypothetical protein